MRPFTRLNPRRGYVEYNWCAKDWKRWKLWGTGRDWNRRSSTCWTMRSSSTIPEAKCEFRPDRGRWDERALPWQIQGLGFRRRIFRAFSNAFTASTEPGLATWAERAWASPL